jgi:spore germination protein YaaH
VGANARTHPASEPSTLAKGNFGTAPVALFYLMETPKSIASFEAHIDKIGLLVPTWYGVDKNGLVNGAPNPGVLRAAKVHELPVMPIISLTERARFHALLGNESAKKIMIARMIDEAKLQGYVGYQFDFENISWTDRDAFTELTKATAVALHEAGLKLSVAVCPNAPGHAGRGHFSKWMYEYWRGVYDIKELGDKYAADFISLMTYDQHTRWTPPGPVDGFPWVKEQLQYALRFVPKERLSLGIPLYGYRWYAGNPVKDDGSEASNIAAEYFDADEWQPMVRQYAIQLQWDPVDQESWFFFYRDQLREWAFVPDARSFKVRLALMKENGLAGFSAWVLGSEDPGIWNELPVVKRSK